VNDTLILCYHALSDRWPADLSVRPAAFGRQLERLAGRGYAGVTFTAAVTQRGRGRRVAVTFDDGFASVPALAKPVLDRLGWPATLFTVTRFAAGGTPLSWDGIAHWGATDHARELAGLDWARLGELADAGWEIGSHTVSHPHLTRLDDAALERELRDSREAVEQGIGRGCPAIAYPYGDVDARVVAAARRAGYRTGAALPARWHRPRALEEPRVGVYHPDDLRRFRVKASPLVRRVRAVAGR
jgi:peptidoglycan/xylan/chitin deacetylase (PgdA/CDA1 family)